MLFTHHSHSGEVLSRFNLGGLLGTGASASVFSATDLTTGRAVAVKVLHPRLASRPELVSRFLEEAQRIDGIENLNITTVISWGTEDDGEESTAWIAYELAEGMSLTEYVELFGPLSPVDAVAMTRGLLSGLEALHQVGLVHRDVTPQNVIINVDSAEGMSSSHIRLIDYGLVGVAGTSTRNGSGAVGNAHFVSPEQARGDGVYAAGDIYQVGAVLYYALTGQTPFSGDSLEELVSAHVALMPPVPSALVAGIPRELDRAVVKAMLKSPMMRYRNVDEFSRSLAAIYGRDETATEVLPLSEIPLDQTKVLPSVSASFADLDRTMLLSSSFTESETAEKLRYLSPRRSKKITKVGWLWPALFGFLLVGAVIVSIASAQPGARDVALGLTVTSLSATPSPDTTLSANDKISVPVLVGLTVEQARAAIVASGLQVGSESVVDSPQQADVVTSSDPSQGTALVAGNKVSLKIASGRNSIPQVAGLDRAEVMSQLSAAGFNITLLGEDGVPLSEANTSSTDRVLQLRPKGGSLLRVGSTVIAVVKAFVAPNPNVTTSSVPVPSVTPISPLSTAAPTQ